jgi:hypothetical protein
MFDWLLIVIDSRMKRACAIAVTFLFSCCCISTHDMMTHEQKTMNEQDVVFGGITRQLDDIRAQQSKLRMQQMHVIENVKKLGEGKDD